VSTRYDCLSDDALQAASILTKIPRNRPTMAAPNKTVAMMGTIQWIVTGTAVHANLQVSYTSRREIVKRNSVTYMKRPAGRRQAPIMTPIKRSSGARYPPAALSFLA